MFEQGEVMKISGRIRTVISAFRAVRALTFAGTEYIGPGTGSLIIQVVIASSVGLLATVGIYWRKIKLLFSRKKRESDTLPEEKND